jgi:hypothetical protein
MDAGDADVVQAVDVVAHDLCRDCGFFCHCYVRSSRRGDGHNAPSPGNVEPAFDDPGLGVETYARHEFRYLGVGILVCPGDEQAVASLGDGVGDAGDLMGCLSLPEDHFRKPLPRGSCVIHSRKREIFHGGVHQTRQRKTLGIGRTELAGAHGIEDRAKRPALTIEGEIAV